MDRRNKGNGGKGKGNRGAGKGKGSMVKGDGYAGKEGLLSM